MSYVILDLEWNGSYSKLLHKFVNEIIEFGAVKTDDSFNIVDRFSMLISPHIGKKLCSKVKELTKITNEELNDKGVPFMEAVNAFTGFIGSDVLMTWGTSDILALIENYSYYTQNVNLPFLSRYCNIQQYCENCLDLNDVSSQLGLSACAQLAEINFAEDEQHRAFADAELSLRCIKHFLPNFDIDKYFEIANDEFYHKMMFKTHYITDFNDPDIDKNQLRFVCADCGRQAGRVSKWKVKNKNFVAEFKCKNCGKSFAGRVSFKKKYDSVQVKKKIIEKKPEEESAKDRRISNSH